MSGPLQGTRVVEVAGIGPGPFAAMMLSDMGAEIVRIDRADAVEDHDDEPHWDDLNRGRRSVALNLKHEQGREIALRMIEGADILLEGFRPGVADRLGIGPDACLARNPGLVYGRMSGWGQQGPYAATPGHDINYIALSGALHPTGDPDRPPRPPLNLVGDFGGGGMLLAFGVVCALLESRASGQGQVVDAAMVDGSALLMAMTWSFLESGRWTDERGTNFLDGSAPYYATYETADGQYVTLGAIEDGFYAELRERLGLHGPEWDDRDDPKRWPEQREALAKLFRTRTRAEWCELLEGTDVCFAPVLSLNEAFEHPHLQARRTYVWSHGRRVPAPAPRFSRTPGDIQGPPPHPGQHTDAVVAELGYEPADIETLRAVGAVQQARRDMR